MSLINVKKNTCETFIIPSKIKTKESINEIYNLLYEEYFPSIFITKKEKFLSKIEQESEEIIKTNYSLTDYIQNLADKSKKEIITKYTNEYSAIKKKYDYYQKFPEKITPVYNFKKHCSKSDDIACHPCNSNTFCDFFEIKIDNNISYIMCKDCKLCYKSNFIKMYCNYCKTEYFTTLLSQSEKNVVLFRATWQKYHCKSIIDDTMKCIKCKSILYINTVTHKLMCLNQKCNFISNDRSIIWKCSVCSKDFKSPAKIYNQTEFIYYKKVIKLALLKKKFAKPKMLPCCKGDIKDCIFYHKEECRGEIYLGNLNNQEIIVCNKCHAMILIKNFIWTCPLCGMKIKDNGLVIGKSFSKNRKCYIFNTSDSNITNNEIESYRKKNLNHIYSNKNMVCNTINNTNKSNSICKINNTDPSNSIRKNKSHFYVNSHLDKYKIKGKIIYIDLTNKINNKITITKNEEDNKYKNIDGFLNPNQNYQNLKGFLNKRNKDKENCSSSYGNENKNKNKMINIQSEKIMRFKTKTNENNNLNLKYLSKDEEEKNDGKNNTNHINNDNDNGILRAYSYSRFHGKYIRNGNGFKAYNTNNYAIGNGSNQKNILLNNFIRGKNISNLNYKNLLVKTSDNIGLKEEPMKIDINNKGITFLNNSQDNAYKERKISQNEKYDNTNYKDFYGKKINLSEKPKYKLKSRFPILKKYKYKENPLNDLQNLKSDRGENKIMKELINKKLNRNNNNIKICKNDNSYNSNNISNDKINEILSDCKLQKFDDSEINCIKQLGKGSEGIIFLVQEIKTKKKYALKKIICHEYRKLLMHKKEFELLYSINHENIMKIYKIQIKRLDFSTYSFDILMERAEKDWITEIRQRIKAKKFYKESEIISILKQVVKGLSFLQKNKIAHRDVKPQNILIFPNNIYKIADFGEADNIDNIENALTLRGSELYMSPILYEGHKHCHKKIVHNPYKSDVFSLGYCTLFAMTLGIQLLDNIREIKDMKIITSMINRYVNKNLYSNKLISLILKMIQLNEAQRFDFIELENELERYKI